MCGLSVFLSLRISSLPVSGPVGQTFIDEEKMIVDEEKMVVGEEKMIVDEEVVIVDEVASQHRFPTFPDAVFCLEDYSICRLCLREVPPHQNILSTISLPDRSWVVIVLKSHVLALEQDFNTTCSPYNFEPSRQGVDKLARMVVDAIARDNTLEKGLVYADPADILELFTEWLEGMASQWRMDPPAFQPACIENHTETRRIELDGYDFKSYTLVRVPDIGHYGQTLDKLGNFDEILSVEGLQDGSWELPVLKSYLPILEAKLRKMVSGCNIESGFDPTKPNANEVEKLGHKMATLLRTDSFSKRAGRMRKSWHKAAAFYADLVKEMHSHHLELAVDTRAGDWQEEFKQISLVSDPLDLDSIQKLIESPPVATVPLSPVKERNFGPKRVLVERKPRIRVRYVAHLERGREMKRKAA